MNLDLLAYRIGWTVLVLGGSCLALWLIGFIWAHALGTTIKAFGETTRTWWDVFCEMHNQGKLRWQKKKNK